MGGTPTPQRLTYEQLPDRSKSVVGALHEVAPRVATLPPVSAIADQFPITRLTSVPAHHTRFRDGHRRRHRSPAALVDEASPLGLPEGTVLNTEPSPADAPFPDLPTEELRDRVATCTNELAAARDAVRGRVVRVEFLKAGGRPERAGPSALGHGACRRGRHLPGRHRAV